MNPAFHSCAGLSNLDGMIANRGSFSDRLRHRGRRRHHGTAGRGGTAGRRPRRTWTILTASRTAAQAGTLSRWRRRRSARRRLHGWAWAVWRRTVADRARWCASAPRALPHRTLRLCPQLLKVAPPKSVLRSRGCPTTAAESEPRVGLRILLGYLLRYLRRAPCASAPPLPAGGMHTPPRPDPRSASEHARAG